MAKLNFQQPLLQSSVSLDSLMNIKLKRTAFIWNKKLLNNIMKIFGVTNESIIISIITFF